MQYRHIFSSLALAVLTAVSVSAGVKNGDAAPDFTLKDIQGTPQTLSSFKGKYVVLEWVNYNCPFVKKHYGSGNMQKLQKKYTGADVVWLSVASTNPKHKDFKDAATLVAESKAQNAAATAVLLDTDGKVGKAYGAKTTPHIYIVAPDGKLIYQGAIDSIASADADDIANAENYLATCLDAAMAGNALPHTSKPPYGCSVKYSK